MYVQLTEADRTVLCYESRGDTVVRIGEVSDWEYVPGTPQTIKVVEDAAHDTYLVVYANEGEVRDNQWHLMWRDDRPEKALDYFLSLVIDLEAEHQIVDANKGRILNTQARQS